MRKILISLMVVALLILVPTGVAQAATTQGVTVTATPGYIDIFNWPDTQPFGVVTDNSTSNTTNGYFSVTNNSTVNIDISIGCGAWSTTGDTAWIYGDPATAADYARLYASSADGGTGGSGGAGAFDKLLPSPTGNILVCDNVTSATDPTWELQLQVGWFSDVDPQEITVTLTAAPD